MTMYTDAPIQTYAVQKGYNILFERVPTGDTVSFPAFLTSFEDSYNSSWGKDSIYGRTEAIHLFQQTNRTISFAIAIPSASEQEAADNLASVRNLAKFLYPTYKKIGRANIIDKTPLIRIKFANLVGRGADGIGSGRLLGVIKTISISPVIEDGFFDPMKSLYPKTLNLSISFDVIHDQSPTSFPAEGEPVNLGSDQPSEDTAISKGSKGVVYNNEEMGNTGRVPKTIERGRFMTEFVSGLERVGLEEIGLAARPPIGIDGYTVRDYPTTSEEINSILDEGQILK